MGGFEGFKRTTRVYVNTIERYSIEDDQWESFSTEGPQLSSLAACAYGNSIYLGGGKNGQWYAKIIDHLSSSFAFFPGRKSLISTVFLLKNVN